MKHPIALLLAATSLALAGCMNDTPDRPRLLASEQARIGELNGLETRGVPLNQPMRTVRLELTSCSPAPQESATPRLVIGEPICVLGSSRSVIRID